LALPLCTKLLQGTNLTSVSRLRTGLFERHIRTTKLNPTPLVAALAHGICHNRGEALSRSSHVPPTCGTSTDKQCINRAIARLSSQRHECITSTESKLPRRMYDRRQALTFTLAQVWSESAGLCHGFCQHL